MLAMCPPELFFGYFLNYLIISSFCLCFYAICKRIARLVRVFVWAAAKGAVNGAFAAENVALLVEHAGCRE